MQQTAATEDVVFGMLAQRNEMAIRATDTYSAGVKGGGDASAAADAMLIPHIDEETPTLFGIQLKYSRHTGTGSGTHLINPSSGLILDGIVRKQPIEFA